MRISLTQEKAPSLTDFQNIPRIHSTENNRCLLEQEFPPIHP